MVSIRSALRLGASLLALSVSAQELTPGEVTGVRTRFEQHQAASRAASVRFTQTLRLGGMKNPAISQGRILFRAPNRLRLDYEQPAGDLLLLRGDETLVVRKGSRPISVQPFARLDARTQRNLELLVSLFTGRLPAAVAGSRLSARREGGSRVVITLAGEKAESVETILSWPALDPVSVRVLLPGGTEMRYDFTALERRAELPENAFAAP